MVRSVAVVNTHPGGLDRRTFLRAAAGGVTAAALTGCGSGALSRYPGAATPDPHSVSPTVPATPQASEPSPSQEADKVLLAYFSRAGENYYNGGRTRLRVGNTEVVARIVAGLAEVDLYRIEAADPYPDAYAPTVERNVREQASDARPEIMGPLPDTSGYATVILASPIWNVRPPMILQTFCDRVDLAGGTVLPLVTYAVSGLGSTTAVYREALPDATIGEALAVRGEDAADAAPEVTAWLRRVGLVN